MDSYKREFLSQYYGRAIGSVELKTNGEGYVRLSFACDSHPARTYCFRAGVFHERPGIPPEEVALRAAIARLHRNARSSQRTCDVSDMLDNATLWIGDFIDSPHQEARVSFVRRGISQQERRNGSSELETTIVEALKLREKAGPRAAREFLTRAQISRAVIRRVLVHRQTRHVDLELVNSAAD